MSIISICGIQVEAGGRRILDVDALDVHEGEVLAVLGPTGAGKSTLLRVLGLLERPVRGEVSWRGERVEGVAPLELRRRITMAFQDPLLFSGTTLDNVLYGLSVRAEPRPTAVTKAMEVMCTLKIEAHAAQLASTLSGGEAHRAALARALVFCPELLLLDEPLASLDEPIREELSHDLLAIITERELSAVLVTHDQAEARAMADRIAVLDEGRLRQVGTPDEVFSKPVDAFVAKFVGTGNILPGTVVAAAGGRVDVAVGDAQLTALAASVPATAVLVCIRSEEISLSRGPGASLSGAAARLSGTVIATTDRATSVTVHLDCGFPLVVNLPRREARELRPESGETLVASVPADVVHLIQAKR